MIICHCGAGTLLESLRSLGDPVIIAVVNGSLMDNHQLELADQLASDRHVYKADGAGKVMDVLTDQVQTKTKGGLVKFPDKTQGVLL